MLAGLSADSGVQASYFVTAVLFIMGLKRMSSPVTARSGILWAGAGMLVATLITFLYPGMSNYGLILPAMLVGGVLAWWSGKRVAMTNIPQMIALYNGMGGGAAAAIAAVELYRGGTEGYASTTLAVAGGIIGAVSFSGSAIAFGKLQGLITRSVRFRGQQFLNLLLLSEEHLRNDLSSLKLITYGTEPMAEITLKKTHAAFPGVRLLQTYGLSELGILRSQSRGSDSLWMRVGGEGYETKIVDGRLFIKAQSAMLGYLNAPSPFDADGFFDTGDLAEVDGEWLRIVGRKSEVINVGGNKVFPLEVENTLLGLDNVEDVAVRGEPNPLTGQIVMATITLIHDEDPARFKTRMRLYCLDKLATYKIPAKVRFVGSVHSERFKKVRAAASPMDTQA